MMKSNSTALALKYRPQTFKDLIGQDVISETIYNSIKYKKSANAFLFTGIRGVGKTTIARIVAKSLNCEKGVDNLCNENFCTHCKSIIESNHIDVLEIDAASKTGVDDVRDLIEFSRYGPTSAKYKIFIIDEVHMLSKQAFNALLKTLEEPPEYLKFIFATTEIKKIPVTVISRCQRFDLSRVKTEKLFQYIKKISEKENGKITNDAIKLIVKISEGSVRDALSLLDRGLICNSDEEEFNLKKAQEVFGYFDKSLLIELFYNLFKGEESEAINLYRKVYQGGVEPKIFLNDFLEILFYIKNISTLKLDGNNFSLNDNEFNEIEKISKLINVEDIILFWQFTVDTINELDIVVNPNLSVEMFLVRLIHLKDLNKIDNQDLIHNIGNLHSSNNQKEILKNNKTIDQIKNISQQDEAKPKSQENNTKILINTFEELINFCKDKKEIKLKYELETNVNLVNFSEGRIEIAFNENLDEEFIKELSNKLYEWTGNRWIILLSKKKGLNSKKQKKKIDRQKTFENVKQNETYNKVLELLPDAELMEFEIKNKKND